MSGAGDDATAAFARRLGAEAALALGTHPLALAVAAAACLGADALDAARLPAPLRPGRRAFFLAAHDRPPLAPLAQILRLAGARPTRLGDAACCPPVLLEAALARPDAGLLVHVPPDGAAPDLAQPLWLARQAGVPVLVGTGEPDTAEAALDSGATLVCLDTDGRGVILGDAARIAAARLHLPYLGRLAPARTNPTPNR